MPERIAASCRICHSSAKMIFEKGPRVSGPLEGIKVVEMAGIGPGPFCAMLFVDMGADVLRIDRTHRADEPPHRTPGSRFDVMGRGRRSVEIDLKKPGAADAVLPLIARADVLIEGFRPGVMERLGLGPSACLERQPKLVYGRMTGWGQHGPLAKAAGHDINYIAVTGALHAVGPRGGPPVPPLNYVGDFGGGAMLLAFGILSALVEAQRSGRGQVVDAAMSDGAALLSAMMYGMKAAGYFTNRRGENLLDGGAPFYGTYECADGQFVALGAIEPQFYAELLRRCGVDDPAFQPQLDRARWPALKEKLAAVFKTKARAEWCAILEGSDACFAPVLDWDEAPQHPHNVARGTFVTVDGVVQPAPAPRFSRTPPSAPRRTAVATGPEKGRALRDWGAPDDVVRRLEAVGAI
jgi:alpha-methylacyl-CoA racemase